VHSNEINSTTSLSQSAKFSIVVASKCDLSVLSWVPFFISKLYFREIREATTDLAFARLGLYIVLFKDVKQPFQVYVILFSVVSDQDVVNASAAKFTKCIRKIIIHIYHCLMSTDFRFIDSRFGKLKPLFFYNSIFLSRVSRCNASQVMFAL